MGSASHVGGADGSWCRTDRNSVRSMHVGGGFGGPYRLWWRSEAMVRRIGRSMMSDERDDAGSLSRRTFLRGAAGLGVTAATGSLLTACGSDTDPSAEAPAAVEGPPENPAIRLPKGAISSFLPMAVASDLLKEEGF